MITASRAYLCFRPRFKPALWCRSPKEEFLRLETYNHTQIFLKGYSVQGICNRINMKHGFSGGLSRKKNFITRREA